MAWAIRGNATAYNSMQPGGCSTAATDAHVRPKIDYKVSVYAMNQKGELNEKRPTRFP